MNWKAHTRHFLITACKPVVLALLCSLLTSSVSGTYSYLTSSCFELSCFAMRKPELRIAISDEEGLFRIRNESSLCCYIRAALDFPDADTEKAALAEYSGPQDPWDSSHLTEEGKLNGYYYYTEALESGELTVPLISSADGNCDVYAEAIFAEAGLQCEDVWRDYLE